MKNKIQMIIFIITQLTGIILAQNLNQNEIDSIINDLYSDDWTVVDNATIGIIYNNITEALPILRDNFWNQSLNSRISYLEAMKVLQSQETLSYSLALFDTLQIKTYQGIDTVYKKLYLIDELFDLGDFSKIDYLDYCANNSMSKSNLELCIQLWGRLLSFPNYSLLAKNRLLEFIQLERYWEVRHKAMSWLEDYYMAELSQLMINRYHQEDNDVIKFNIIRKYTQYGDFETVSNLLKYILVNDTDTICKQIAYEKLLTEYRTPSNYVYVISWLNDESSYSEFKRLNKVYEEYICPGTPFQPDSTISIKEIIDTTSSYVSQSIMYYWLGDLSFSNELKNILTTAKTYLQNGDSLACRVQVKAFQDLVDNVYKDSLNTDARFVTIEGWKFLYWNAQYILDRLPSPPVVVNADIEVINPAMSLVNPGAFTIEIKGTGFTTNSTVYFNGNARTTTYFSDTLLTAEIQSTDVSVAGNYPVWVSSGTTNSDTLIYSVVTTLPKPVRPVLECVTNNGDGTYTAYFGYKNDNTVSVYIPAGIKNKFTPTPQDRGQTKVFLPGRKYKVFTVSFNGSNLVWTLNGRTSTASSNSAPCN